MRRRKYVAADLLCGAGGMSTGCIRALLSLGYTPDEIVLYCLNHWQIAIDTHSLNHPGAIHICQDIAVVRPHQVVTEGYLDLLLAAPTCTHHSLARGGKPTSDQQRSDPWHIIPWFTELRVKAAMIENVWEYTSWGPVDPRTGRPVKARKGEFFHAWKDTILKLGATSFEYRKLNAANYGGATTRVRFVAKIRFDRIAVGWAPITHQKHVPGRLELFPTMKPWRPARAIIKWDIKGKSIFGRPIPLAPKTLARILAGATKFGWPHLLCVRIAGELQRSLRHHIAKAFKLRHAPKAKVRKLALKKLAEQLAWLRHILATPDVASHAMPCRTPGPMLVVLRRNADARSLGQPVPALAASGQHIGLAEPIIFNGRRNSVAKPAAVEPIPALDTKGGVWLAEPFVLSQASGGAPRSTEQPLPTAPTGGAHALIAPYYGSGSGTTCSSSEEPLPAITSIARFGMVVPITHSDGSSRARDVDVDPLPVITTANRGELAFVDGSDEMDCLYRMLVPDELAAAMGLAGYAFAGNKTEQIKQIGNAVSVEMAEAEVSALVAPTMKPARAAVRLVLRRAVA